MSTSTAKKPKPARPGRSIQTMIRMPAEVRSRLEKLAEREDRSVSKMAVLCIEQGLPLQESGS